jgi:hypothetical protein
MRWYRYGIRGHQFRYILNVLIQKLMFPDFLGGDPGFGIGIENGFDEAPGLGRYGDLLGELVSVVLDLAVGVLD